MRLVPFLQHGVSGTGTRLHVPDVVPEPHPSRPWAETFPWAAVGSAIEHSWHKRFPTLFHCGQRPSAHPSAIHMAHPRPKTPSPSTRQFRRSHQRSMRKGRSHGPAQCGRTPGMVSDPATSVRFATRVPEGHPSAARDVRAPPGPGPKGERPRQDTAATPGPLGGGEPRHRVTRHCGRRTVGIPKTIAPIQAHPESLSRRSTFSPRRAYTVGARLFKSGWPVRVATALQWWKALSPVCCRAALARCGTKVIQGPWNIWA